MPMRFLRVILATLLVGSALTTVSVSAQDIYGTEFYDTWARSDGPIAHLVEERTWMWGPGPYASPTTEPYADSLGGNREVVYFDKTRMEINDPHSDRSSPWFVTNGLLARELISGRMQLGDAQFEQRESAECT
jgi:hypothetical protein